MEEAPGLIPPPITTSMSEEFAREASSPQDASLQARKVERQTHKNVPRPSPLSPITTVGPGIDSPALQGRMDQIAMGTDPTQTSSPVGTALLNKKMARGAGGQSTLADPTLAGGGPAEETSPMDER